MSPKLSKWREGYQAVLLESDRDKLNGRIDVAKRVIYDRWAELKEGSDSAEAHALAEALATLRFLAEKAC